MRRRKLENLSKEMSFLIRQSRENTRKNAAACRAVSENRVSVLLLDRTGSVTFCNEVQKSRARALSGVEMEEGRRVFDQIADGSLGYRRENLEKALQGEASEGTAEIEVPGGSTHWYSMHYDPVVAGDGVVLGACLTAKDISRLRRTEKALEESEERYRFLVENQNDLLVKLDANWQLRFVNPSYLKMFGKSEAELLGRTFFHLIHENDREPVRASLESLKHPPFVCHHEERAMTRDGWRWISWSNRAIVDEVGRVLEVIAVGRDITLQKEAEAALKRSNRELEELNRKMTLHGNFLQALLDSIPVPVFYKDAQFRYLGCNEAFNRITGLPSEALLGKTAREIWPRDFSEGYHQKDEDLLEDLREQEFEFQIAEKDGPVHDVIYRKNVFRDDRGRIAGIVGAMVEITERKKAEGALKRSEEQFRLLFEKAPMGYQSLDREGRLIMVNQTWLDILGYTRQEVIGKSFTDFMPEESVDLFQEAFFGLMEKGFISGTEFQLRKKDGKILDAAYSGITVVDDSGDFMKTQCVFFDISEAKETIRNLKEAAGQAEILKGRIPICAGCRKIQDDSLEGKPWVAPELYISSRLPSINFSHGMCPDCLRKWYPDYKG